MTALDWLWWIGVTTAVVLGAFVAAAVWVLAKGNGNNHHE